MLDERPTHLDLFSGIGGFALAAQWAGFRTVAFCEIDPYCRRVLSKNFLADSVRERRQQVARSAYGNETPNERRTEEHDHQLAGCSKSGCPTIHGNIFDFDGREFAGVDLVTGGFPCQPFSVAGKRGGASDDRAIWPQMFRVIDEARPAWVLGENVPGIIPMELDNVLSDLEGIGYACRPFVIPACAVDARHRRDRVWIVGRNVANPYQGGIRRSGSSGNERHVAQCSKGLADANESGSQGRNSQELRECSSQRIARSSNSPANTDGESQRRPSIARSECCEWLPEPDVGRVAHGIPSRVDRLKGLGNAIVPQVAYEILSEIRTQC